MIHETKYIVGGLNVDDAYSVMPKEDYQNAENVRIVVGEDGKMGLVKNPSGNLEVSNANYIEGFTIGAIEDKEKLRCYYFVYNGDAQSAIFCYRYQENDVKLILRETDFSTLPPNQGLNFPANRKITGLAVVGDILYWTDNLNQPRKINVERALATYDNTLGTDRYNTILNDEDITIIQPQPILPLVVSKIISANDAAVTTRTNNFIAEESFQFSHRYIYNDNEVSALSVYSTLVNYNNDDDSDNYDTIKVSLSPYQVIPSQVRKVQILVRSGNTGSFSIIKEFDPSSHTLLSPLNFYFFNEKNGNPIADEIAYKLFDNVPISSKALESARNRLFLGNNKYGYNPIESLEISVSIDTITAGAGPETGKYIYGYYEAENPNNDFEVEIREEFYVIIETGANAGIYETDVPAFGDEAGFDAGTLPVSITVSPSQRIGDAGLTDQQIIDLEFSPPAGWIDGSRIERTYGGSDPLVFGLEGTSILDGYRQYKTDGKYRFGIVFYDNWGRNNGVYTNDDMLFITPDRIYTQTSFNGNAVWSVSGLGTQIPEWATHYQIVRTKNLFTSSFLQHFTRNPQYVEKDNDGIYTFATTYDSEAAIGLAFDISRIENDGLGYTYTEGDILKFHASDDSAAIRLNLKDQQGKYVITEPVDLGDLSLGANANTVGVIEILTPSKEEDIFYEVGKVFRVTNPTRFNRDFGVRMGSIPGDTYIKVRSISGEGDLPMEAMNVNDRHWTEWLTDIGRPNVILYESGQEIRPTNITYSETYIQGTKVNGLSSFNALDQRDLDEQNGEIQKLLLTSRTQEYGNIMLAICSLETNSIYLGETEVRDNSNNAILATSGQVIGTINSLKGSYGTINPESVAEHEGNAYFFDAINGKVIRYSLNGLEPISNVKMSKFFTEVGKSYLIDKNGYFPGAYDPYSDEYLLSIPQVLTDTREFLEDIIEESYSLTNRDILNDFDLGVLVSDGDKYIIKASAGNPNLSGTVNIYFTDANALNQVLVYSASGEGDPIEYIAQGPGRFTASSTFQSTIKITKPTNSFHSIFDGRSKVMVFNEDSGRWTDARTFVPDYMSSVPNLLLSFKFGRVYRHDSTVKNSFYGLPYKSLLALVFNEHQVPVKSLRTVHTQGNTYPYVHCRTEEYNIQSSDLMPGELRSREGVISGGIMKDRLSPNVEGTTEQKMISGDVMRGQFPQVAFQFDTQEELEVYLFRLGYTISGGHVVQG